MKKEIIKNVFKFITAILMLISIVIAIMLFVLTVGITGKTTNLLTQISTWLFPTIAPINILISIVLFFIFILIVIFQKEKIYKYISICGLIITIICNFFTAICMGKYVNIAKNNGGSYSFLNSFKITSYRNEKSDEEVIYRTIDGEDLTVSVYKNKENKTNLPIYIYIHGGGWTSDNSRAASTLHRYFANNDFVAFSINYRLASLNKPTWDKAIDDCAYSIKWIYDNAYKYGGDNSKIYLLGESAGGNLALIYAGAESSGKIKNVTDAEPVNISKVAVIYPVIDIESYANEALFFNTKNEGGLIEPYIGGTTKEYPERVEYISPITYLSENLPNTLIIHGDKDSYVTINGSIKYEKRAKELGSKVKLVTLPYRNHATEIFNNNMSNQVDKTIIMNFLKNSEY